MLNQNLQLILVVYWITNLAMGVTLSGNGTSGGFTVQENSSLQLTCSTSTDVNYVSYNVRLLSLTKIITAVGFGPLGCATDPAPPSYLSCSCVSRREYVCVIRTVTRNMNGDVWFCLPPAGDSNDNSGDKTIVVTIGITAVSMDFPAVRSLSVIDNTARQFRCATSVGNPQAIVEWYKDNGTPNRADDTEITTGKETYPIPSGSLIVTIGKLTLTVQRNDHEVGVYCRANNGGDWVYSVSVFLDVQYDPSTPKVSYKNADVTSQVRVISGRPLTLTCSSTGNPPPTYIWTYPDGDSHSGPTLQLASVLQTHTGGVTCTAMNTLSPTGGTAVDKTRAKTITLQVLYPPHTPLCTISGTSISTTVVLVEGTDSTITCTSSANPPLITYIWSTPRRGLLSGASLSLINVQHLADQGQYTLTITNTMDPTGGKLETGTNSTMFSVDVQYEPSSPKVSYKGFEVSASIRVISGRSVKLNCSSTGNPQPTYTWWYPGGGSHEGQTLLLANIQAIHAGEVKCTARNKLSPTGGTLVDRTEQTATSINVLYPPSKPVCTLSETTISTTAVLLEGTDTTISCISTAFPTLITYTWSTPSRGLVSGASLSLTNVQHHADQGLYTLTVRNTMDPTKGNTKTGTNTTALSVDVQFGPKVQLPQTYDILEGSVLNYHCPFIPGNPSQTSLVWTSSVNNRQWNSQIVSISSVQKSDDGMYTCTATNQMTPTGYPVQTGSQGGNMHLNVQYESIVNDFYVTEYIGTFNVTQTENSNVTFTCTVDSNPLASINIRKDSEMKISIDHSRQLKYTIAKLTCWDTGLYTCDSRNAFNKKNLSKKYLNLCVTCTPRRAPGLDIKMNLTARQHENTTLQYTVFAFPVPSPSQFVWKKCTSSKKCSTLSNISGKTEITTIGLSSNLTIFDIAIDDYGVYSISIDNGIGEALVEMIYLKQAEISHVKPQTSTIAGGVTAGILTVLGILVVILVLRRKYSVTCAFKFTRKEGPRSRHIAHGAENPGYDVAATYEEVSMTSDKTVYEALSMANIRNGYYYIGNEGSNKSHVYTTLDDSNSKPNAYYENVKEEDPVYKNTSLKTPVQTVL
ncbi:hemicentin-1-like isoform X4 [Mya arenaria]|uniref:hemicentin-1-like isoform X4 n=1 Tax=Mya arenaria TaxID=6604 RepID=UPI0022E5E021|nr:hemicentin-1-like isoform X4 [Mya arenaria]